jgi:hypothetical protein
MKGQGNGALVSLDVWLLSDQTLLVSGTRPATRAAAIAGRLVVEGSGTAVSVMNPPPLTFPNPTNSSMEVTSSTSGPDGGSRDLSMGIPPGSTKSLARDQPAYLFVHV